MNTKTVLSKKQLQDMKAAADETRAMQEMPEHLLAIKKFKPIFAKLAERSETLMFDIRAACKMVIEFLKVAPTKEGKKQAMLAIKGCTNDSSVLNYSSRWVAVLLAEKKGANIGTVTRESAEGTWADVPATVALIETHSELLASSTLANEALGVKKRNPHKKAKDATAATPDTVYDVLPRMIVDPVALVRIRAIFNAAGYAIVTNLEASTLKPESIPGTMPADRKLRKAA